MRTILGLDGATEADALPAAGARRPAVVRRGVIASGTGAVVSPIASAPANSRRVGAVRGIGAIGYGLERRVEPAWGSAEPQTPISYSAWV